MMRTVGDDLILGGDRPRGTLYAVFTFLEDVVGCRWWTAEAEQAPQRPTLEVDALDVVYRPPLEYRCLYGEGTLRHPTFAAKLRLNGRDWAEPIPEDWGGSMTMGGGHTLLRELLPPDRYFEEHRDWYAYRADAGERVASQVCFTNPGAIAAAADAVCDLLEQNHATTGTVSVSPADNLGYCRCEQCRALATLEGSEAGPLLHFVNAVAERVEERYPDVWISTLAYWGTERPPRHVRPRRNVVPVFAMLNRNHALGPRGTPRFIPYLQTWAQISPKLYVWDYYAHFGNFILPHPNHLPVGEYVRSYAANGIAGFMAQMGHGSLAEFCHLREWVLAHLLWDPSLDERELTRRFLEGYYGDAAPYLLEYLALIHRAVTRRPGTFLGVYDNTTAHWFAYDDVDRATVLFDRAQAAVAEDPTLLRRLRRTRAGLDLVWIQRYRSLRREALSRGVPFRGPDDPYGAVERFAEVGSEFGCSCWKEWDGFGHLVEHLRRLYPRPAPAPPRCEGLPPGQWWDIQENMLELQPEGATSLVDDAAAADGRAARLAVASDGPRGFHQPDEGEIAFAVPQAVRGLAGTGHQGLTGRWQVYVVARVEATEAVQAGAHTGIYAPHELVRRAIPGGEAGTYHTVDLGVHDLGPGARVWVMPSAGEAVQAIYVDRMFLVAQ
ncbi:MAG TPA: DUF4838 domain-containing protein [Thioalkalivibrio sp.]|nr:DUF4838 domain-containing protein [Thioalkalivibrio sp.]